MSHLRPQRELRCCRHAVRRLGASLVATTLTLVVLSLAWVPSAAALDNGLARTPPMGWNPWYRFRCDVNEELVRQTARAMVSSGMKAAGYRYVNLDDCWMARTRDVSGSLVPDPAKFPSGIRALADYVHRKGLKFGIYADMGAATCAEFPGSRGHFDQDARTFAAWGVDYLKLDACQTTPDELGPGSAGAMLAALRRARRPMVFSLATAGGDTPISELSPWIWAGRFAHLWRTTDDFTRHHPRAQTWDGLMEVVDINARLSRYARPGAWNDPDLLQVGNPPLTPREGRSIFSLWAMMAAPLIADNDLRRMTAYDRQTLINREVIAVDQDRAGLQGTRVRTSEGREIWVRRLANGDRAVLLFARRPTAARFAVSLGALAFGRGGVYAIRNLWTHRTTTGRGPIGVSVPGHGVAMFRIRRMRAGG